MRVMIGLSVSTGLPWQYFDRQDDEVIATYLDILRRARGKMKGSAPNETPGRAPQMSG
jgi:hypothetical protein